MKKLTLLILALGLLGGAVATTALLATPAHACSSGSDC